MALHTAPTTISAPRAVLGRRGVPTRLAIEVNAALAPCVEGQAFCDDVAAAVERLTTAVMAGSRHAVMNETGRLALRAQRYRAEFRRMAADIEGPEGTAA